MLIDLHATVTLTKMSVLLSLEDIDNDDDDADEEDLMAAAVMLHVVAVSVGSLLFIPDQRRTSWFQQRLAWNVYAEKHNERGTFARRLRMTMPSFQKLVALIEGDLQVHELCADMRGGVIIPEICLYCTLRYLAGGSYLDITDVAGISQASFYRLVWKTVTAIVKCKALSIRFPQTPEEATTAIVGFSSISTDNAIHNCAGVVDGYLMRCRVPAKKEVKNVRSFFSGHYQCYGVNIQAASDHLCRFIHFAFAAPGVTGDRDAIKQCSLHGLIERLPPGICVIGDAAYQATEHMVPVYQGSDKLVRKYDDFNFFASQCRIRIEMAFGMMQAKWGILQRPLGCSIKNMLWLAQAVARLHNYCINERLAATMSSFEVPDRSIPSYIPSVPHNEDGDPVQLVHAFQGTNDGHSMLREYMATRVEQKKLQRPSANRASTGRGDVLETGAL
jgi:DDE superfamily endonuclease